VGTSGIQAGTNLHPVPASDVVRAIRIVNNYVHDCGLDYHDGIGIIVRLATSTVIAHNEVCRVPYSGISLGWRWDPDTTISVNHLIEANEVHQFMNQLSDGGGIYTLGFHPNSYIRANYIHQSGYHGQGTYGSSAIDLDNGSKGLIIEQNITCDAGGQRINGNANSVTPPDWYTWGTNYFNVCPSQPDFPKELAEKAGLQSPYRERLLKTP
jgi:hypothetical protein